MLLFVLVGSMYFLYYATTSLSLSPTTTISTSQYQTHLIRGPQLLLKPQRQRQRHYQKQQFQNVLKHSFHWYREHWYYSQSAKHPKNATTTWETTNLPLWMKDYFRWHNEKTQKISNKNNHTTLRQQQPEEQQQQRYLVVQCLEQDVQCGGLADRMLALPTLLLLAAQSRRLLLLVWTVPFPLQEFLMPNSIDWMLPTQSTITSTQTDADAAAAAVLVLSQETLFLSEPSIVDQTVFVRLSTLQKALFQTKTSQIIVRTRLQDYQSAWNYYNQYDHSSAIATAFEGASSSSSYPLLPPLIDTNSNSNSNSNSNNNINQPNHKQQHSFAEQHYRELFFVLFRPSPPLQQALMEPQHRHHWTSFFHYNTTFQQPQPQQQSTTVPLTNSTKQRYAVAHYRALYGSQSTSTTYQDVVAKNAIRCAAQLLLQQQAINYGNSTNTSLSYQKQQLQQTSANDDNVVVFLSDSADVRERLRQQQQLHKHDGVQHYSATTATVPREGGYQIVLPKSKHKLLHLDKASRQQQQKGTTTVAAKNVAYQPMDFYDIFLDLYVMANADCVSYGQGGFGRMGSLLSRNRTCSKKHFERGKMVVPCVK